MYKYKSVGFGFEYTRKTVDSDSGSNLPPTGLGIGFELLIVHLNCIDSIGFESGFGFKAVGFGFGSGFKKIEVDSDSSGFGFEAAGFGSGFETPGFAHHCSGSQMEQP